MYVTAFFTYFGSPKLGLTPTISIWRVSDNVLLINEVGMSEVGGGFYKYNFVAYDGQQEYAIRCDGGVAQPFKERYMYAGNEGFHDDILDIKDDVSAIDTLVRRILGLSQENYRLFNTVYDGTGERLVSCLIKIYNNKSDCDNDVNEITSYNMESVYAMNGQLSSYKVTRNV